MIIDEKALFEDLMDELGKEDLSSKTSAQRLTDMLGSDEGMYDGEDDLDFTIEISYSNAKRIIFEDKIQLFVNIYDRLITLLDSSYFIKRYQIWVNINPEFDSGDFKEIEKKNISPDDLGETLGMIRESHGPMNTFMSLLIYFDAEDECSQMRFYIDMKQFQKVLSRALLKPSDFAFFNRREDSIASVYLNMNYKLELHKLNQIYGELYPTIVLKDIDPKKFMEKIHRYDGGYVHHICVLDWLNNHADSFPEMKFHYFGFLTETFGVNRNLSTFLHFMEFTPKRDDVVLTTNAMISFVERYIINMINHDDVNQLTAWNDDAVGEIFFYIICNDDVIDNPDSTLFHATKIYKYDERIKFFIQIVNDELRRVDISSNGTKETNHMNVMPYHQFEALQKRYEKTRNRL